MTCKFPFSLCVCLLSLIIFELPLQALAPEIHLEVKYNELIWSSVLKTTDCTPYLLQLGLTKSRTSLVWIAGPLSGLIMQPLVGVITDRSTSKWGRRRPFMVVGSLLVGLCLLLLGWTTELVALFVTDEARVCAYRAICV